MASKKRKSASEEEPSPKPKQVAPKPLPHEEETSLESESEEEVEEEPEDESSSSEDDGVDSKRDTIKKLLQPFGKDQLINILIEAADKTPSITAHIIKSIDSDPIHRKIFVHGLAWDTTTETLTSAFNPHGPLEECNVVTDKTTGRSKGYGFVLFKTRAAARKALKQPQRKIGNRMASCQLACAGPVQNQPQSVASDAGCRRLYVANVGPQIAAEKLRAFFAKFGEIEDGSLGGIDKETGKFRGYAIIVYTSVEGIRKALEEPVKFFDGSKLLCSVATEGRNAKNKMNSNNTNYVAAGAASGIPGVSGASLSPNGVALPMQLNPGFVSQAFSPGAVLMAQSPGFGFLNPVLGVGAGGPMNQVGFGFPGSYPGGVSQSLNRVGIATSMGLSQMSAGFGPQPAISSISPSVIGNYGSQAALQGLGTYQSSQLGQSSAATRSQTGIGSVGTLPSYLGR
ncbi:UBP1-associated protein 2B-like [Alnus glutinosa]|uniref:UBP1-associated protein 2B-like n=1 Tax=Alnus glutinosa TaxID=3517 RepID=UPI002D77F4E9|nr:UBP1-associated protein 2B-like [Alnus glutinosa]XP_062171851.1 UBP1-associated protein 2B-like [Alnus glutinosa]